MGIDVERGTVFGTTRIRLGFRATTMTLRSGVVANADLFAHRELCL